MNDPFKQGGDARKVLIAGEDAEGRIDVWLAGEVGGDLSRSRLKALIEQGAVLLNGTPVTEPKRRCTRTTASRSSCRSRKTPNPRARISRSMWNMRTTT